jgi:hypothetical protein
VSGRQSVALLTLKWTIQSSNGLSDGGPNRCDLLSPALSGTDSKSREDAGEPRYQHGANAESLCDSAAMSGPCTSEGNECMLGRIDPSGSSQCADSSGGCLGTDSQEASRRFLSGHSALQCIDGLARSVHTQGLVSLRSADARKVGQESQDG